MLPWLWKKFRRWRKKRSPEIPGLKLSPSTGAVTIAACSPGGQMTPVMRTVFRPGRFYREMHDVELRGFLDGSVKFVRNVATQYHVRIGCESTGPRKGCFEVMRVLERWSLASLPEGARIESARLVLRQEDTTAFPHFFPLRWPVTFYLYEVKKPWNPGRGGVQQDNLSRPEPGDAWWLEAMAGERGWREPGCGFASDQDADADRGAQPLAAASLLSPRDDLVFSGDRFRAHVEKAAAGEKVLNLLIAAGREEELLPGTVRAFYSGEFGDDINPELRPSLELEWQAPAVWVETHRFVLEPGSTCFIRPRSPAIGFEAATLCASLRSDAPLEPIGGVPGSIPYPSLLPEVYALDWKTPEVSGDAIGLPGTPLSLPSRGETGRDFQIGLSTAVCPVEAGSAFVARVLQTWVPDLKRREDLLFDFTFQAPSGRTFKSRACPCDGHSFECKFSPDEMGLWAYLWRARPDKRFREQRGSGHFTVVRAQVPSHYQALRAFAATALDDARSGGGHLAHRRSVHRLTALGREARSFLSAELARGAPGGSIKDLESLLEELAKGIPRAK